MTRYFATCARGLEPLLAEELRALGADAIETGRGGCGFAGDRAIVYRANLSLRTAIRVLRPILEARVASPEELYDACRTVNWSDWFTLDHTFAVDANVRDSAITHSQYAARRVKDAICDQFRDHTGRRPNVDPETPMIGLNLHVAKNQMILSLDSSGESLHKRGYRPVQTVAPLNEALAAGLLLRAGFRGDRPFADPMCGSATLPIEACWIALNRPPGLTRKRFGFMGWPDFDIGEWAAIRDDARRRVRSELSHPIVGSDARKDVIELATANAKAAGVGHRVSLHIRPLHEFQPPDGPPGLMLVNPPYGERIGGEPELRGSYRQLGALFRRLPGWACWVFTGNPRLAREVGLPVQESMELFNGPITCRLIRFA